MITKALQDFIKTALVANVSVGQLELILENYAELIGDIEVDNEAAYLWAEMEREMWINGDVDK